MAKATVALVLVPFLSLLPFSSHALTQDLCVADLNSRDTPAGYPCKLQSDVTADDFYYNGLAKPGPEISPFNARIGTAFVSNFPGVNGLGISAARFDIAPGGVVGLHAHPDGTELYYVLEGSMVVGFISSDRNTVYMKTLSKGDLFVIPVGLLHFQYNAGTSTTAALAVGTYSTFNPGVQFVDFALFKSTLPADVVKKISFLDLAEVRRLKDVFGGSG